jgi:hypothetical protein
MAPKAPGVASGVLQSPQVDAALFADPGSRFADKLEQFIRADRNAGAVVVGLESRVVLS